MTATYPLGDVPIPAGISEEEANYLLALVSNDIARGATWSEQDHRGLAEQVTAKLWAILYPDRCPNCGIGNWYEACVFCATFGAHDGECHHHRPFPGHECEQTPCIVCGAPLLAGIGHDKGCAVVLLSSALALTRRDYSNLWSMAQRSYNEAAAAGLDEIAAYFRSLVIRLEAVQS